MDVLSSVLEFAPDAVVIIDASGRIVFGNRQVFALFGASRLRWSGKAASCGCPRASAHDTSTTVVDIRNISASAEWAATSTCSHGETTGRSLRSRSA